MTADLSPSHLLRSAWDAFAARPALMIGIWLVYVLVESGFGVDGSGLFSGLLLVASFALSGPITGGFDLAVLRHLREDTTLEFADVFAGLSKFGNLFVVFLASSLAILTGFVLFVVPGIIAGLGLWPAYLIVMEDDRGAFEALGDAWELTNGYKLELFLLLIVSTVLYLVGMIAFVIGILITGPIVQLAWIKAYDEMRTASQTSKNRVPHELG